MSAPEVLRWLRPRSQVVHLATKGSTAAFCGVVLNGAVAVASDLRTCGHCARARRS